MRCWCTSPGGQAGACAAVHAQTASQDLDQAKLRSSAQGDCCAQASSQSYAATDQEDPEQRTFHGRQAGGLLQGGKVDGLEDLPVQLLRLRAVKGQAQQDEGVRQALQASRRAGWASDRCRAAPVRGSSRHGLQRTGSAGLPASGCWLHGCSSPYRRVPHADTGARAPVTAGSCASQQHPGHMRGQAAACINTGQAPARRCQSAGGACWTAAQSPRGRS